jgi:hypothetical protein
MANVVGKAIYCKHSKPVMQTFKKVDARVTVFLLSSHYGGCLMT